MEKGHIFTWARHLTLAGLITLFACPAPALSQEKGKKEGEPAKPAFIKMKVREVRRHKGGGYAVILQTTNRKKVVPIWIGRREAQAIQMRLSKTNLPRPLTHDLLESALTILGAKVTRVEVMDIQDKVFIGKLDLKDAGGKHYRLDGRPSDLITLAVGAGLPIHVSMKVFKKAGVDMSGEAPGKVSPAVKAPRKTTL